MLNYANMFVIVLDENMNIKFMNWSLSKALGLENEEIALGKCWLDFVSEKDKTIITGVHSLITKREDDTVKEFMNDIVDVEGNCLRVKWFNIHINNDYDWTFSIGLLMQPVPKVTRRISTKLL